MEGVRVIPVQRKGQLREFLHLPWKIYGCNPYWVPPLLRDQKVLFSSRNPFFAHAEVAYFLAWKGGETIGRVAAILNHLHIHLHQEKAGFFGFFECLPDYEAAIWLLDAARGWLKEKGMQILRGPMNFSTNEECGFLLEGYDSSPFLMMPYNPPYYPDFMSRYGLRKAKDLLAYIVDIPKEVPPRLLRVAEAVKAEGVRVRTIDMRRFEGDIETIREIYNAAWSENWGFLPLSPEEIAWTACRLRPLVVPELALLAEVAGAPVGFMLCLPDYNQALKRLNGRLGPLGLAKFLWYKRSITDFRVMVFGIRPGHRKKGIDALLYLESLKAAHRLGYRRAELSWVLEDNVLLHRVAAFWGARPYKRYRVFEGEV